MNKVLQVLKTTVLGGVIFLVPFAFLLMIAEKVFTTARKVADPIKSVFPANDFFGVNLIVILIIFGFCYLAGMLARKSAIARRTAHLDKTLVKKVPGYMQMKGIISGHIGEDDDDENKMEPVLVRDAGGGVRLGFSIERDPNGFVVVFFPGVPNTQSGSASAIPADRVEKLDMSRHKAMDILQFYGRGLAEIAGDKATAKDT